MTVFDKGEMRRAINHLYDACSILYLMRARQAQDAHLITNSAATCELPTIDSILALARFMEMKTNSLPTTPD